MFSVSRVYAIVLRYVVSIKNDPGRLIDRIFWPMLDITLIGFMGAWTMSSQPDGAGVFLGILASIVLWQVVLSVNNEACMSVLEEIWDQNMVNLFSTPLRCSEWMLGIMIAGLLRGVLSGGVAALTAYVLFGFSFSSPALFLFVPLLVMCGWFVGFVSASAVIAWGDSMQQMAWMAIWLYAIVSGIFCPLEALPYGFQLVGSWFPMTYLFKAIRLYYSQGVLDFSALGTATLLVVIYFGLSVLLFSYMFEKSRVKGLARRR